MKGSTYLQKDGSFAFAKGGQLSCEYLCRLSSTLYTKCHANIRKWKAAHICKRMAAAHSQKEGSSLANVYKTSCGACSSMLYSIDDRTHCNTLQHTATRCSTLQHAAAHCNTLQHTATRCSTLQHAAAHCNTLQHTTTRCSTLHAVSCLQRCLGVECLQRRLIE